MLLFVALKELFLAQYVPYTIVQKIPPMKEKHKFNAYKENHGKQSFKKNISEELVDYPHFKE